MPKLYYPTPDQLQGASPMDENAWFRLHQPLLLKLANTHEGRDLLCLDPWRQRPYPIVRLTKNLATYYMGQQKGRHYFVSDCRGGAKWGNVVRSRWLVVEKALDQMNLRELLALPRLVLLPNGRWVPMIAGGVVTTKFPDPDPETATVDGRVDYVDLAGVTWATIRDAANGTSAGDTGATGPVRIRADTITDRFDAFSRNVFLFDFSSIADTDTKDSATFEVVGSNADPIVNNFTSSVALVTTTPASNTGLVVGDYSQFGTVDQATRRTLAGLTADNVTYQAWTINATGLGNISLTGITKFGLRISQDADNAAPAWSSAAESLIVFIHAEEAGTGKDPKLVLTHTAVVIPVAEMMAGIRSHYGEQQPSLIPMGVVPY